MMTPTLLFPPFNHTEQGQPVKGNGLGLYELSQKIPLLYTGSFSSQVFFTVLLADESVEGFNLEGLDELMKTICSQKRVSGNVVLANYRLICSRMSYSQNLEEETLY